MIVYLVSTKLDFATKREWEKDLLAAKGKTTFKKMIEFLENHCKYLHRVTIDKPEVSNNNKRVVAKVNNGKQFEKLTSHATTKKICPLCNESHTLYNCEKLRALPVSSRIEEVRRLRICFNCLTPGHHNRQCHAGPCTKCKRKHNTLLHLETSVSSNVNNRQDTNVENNLDSKGDQFHKTTLIAHSKQAENEHIILGTAIVQIKDYKGRLHECRALLDSCSQVNIMTRELCEKLNLPIEKSETVVSGIFKSEQEPHYRTQITFNSRYTGFSQKNHVSHYTKNYRRYA